MVSLINWLFTLEVHDLPIIYHYVTVPCLPTWSLFLTDVKYVFLAIWIKQIWYINMAIIFGLLYTNKSWINYKKYLKSTGNQL